MPNVYSDDIKAGPKAATIWLVLGNRLMKVTWGIFSEPVDVNFA